VGSVTEIEPGFNETVVHLAAEYWPYARTGGLGEAVRGIARYQARSGVPTVVMLPLHRRIRRNYPWLEPCWDVSVRVDGRTEHAVLYRAPANRRAPTVYFVENGSYFDRPRLYGDQNAPYPDNHRRFAFFSRVALEALPRISPGPTLLHAHDWHTALALIYLRTEMAGLRYYDSIPSVLTVHNAGFQGHYLPDVLDELGVDRKHYHWRFLEWYGQVNLLKGALVCSDMVSTVSPTHARELRTPRGGFGLHAEFDHLLTRFVGILNGIELDLWDPSNDLDLPAEFSAEDLRGKAECKRRFEEQCGFSSEPLPLVGMSARLVHQKGLDLILAADILDLPARWVFLGHGALHYHQRLNELARKAPDRVAVRFDFTEELEHRLLAAADMLLMPSLYEPCGITQMRAQRYGALPVGRRVGGLADTIEDRVTGFLFDEYQPWALRGALNAALQLYADAETWNVHVREAMSRDFGWARSVTQYHDLYRRAVARRRERPALP
jgi:starch synthase